MRLVVAWLVVGVPLAYGVVSTVGNAMKLFTPPEASQPPPA